MAQESQAFFTFAIPGLSSELRVLRFDGREGMSQLYEFEIELLSDDQDIKFDDVIGKPSHLQMTTPDGVRTVHGIVSCFEHLGTSRRFARYAATVVPSVWTLGLKQNCRIFQAMDVQAIVTKVLTDAGFSEGDGDDFVFDLQDGPYLERDYCVQYRESDLDFISRLLEEEGITYFFRHAEGGHTIVFADTTGTFESIEGSSSIAYREDSGLVSNDEHVQHLRATRSLRVGKVALRDFNFEKIDLDLHQEGEGESDIEKKIEYYDYPGHYSDAGGGSDRSSVMLESLRAEKLVVSAESNCRRLLPGFKYDLVEHPREDLNEEYLLVRVRHTGEQKQAADGDAGFGGEGGDVNVTYRNTFDTIPASTMFMPPQVTPVARIDGPQTAIVTGPSGEEIFCDAHGRVKVMFHWDRLGKKDETSSCWIRVSQAWAGSGFGGMVLPRIGQEVVVDFLEGDPDRPLITGRVYNGTNTHGYTLPDDKTKTSIKSNSSPGGGGSNEMRFEDLAGSEELFMQAQKDMNVTVKNDKTQDIANDHTETVGNDQTLSVKRDRSETVGRNETVTIAGEETYSVKGARSDTVGKSETLKVDADQSLTVGGNRTIKVGGDQTHTVGGDDDTKVGGKQSLEVGGARNSKVGAEDDLKVGANWVVSVDGDESVTVKGKGTLKYGKDVGFKTDGKFEIKVDGASFEIICGSAKFKMESGGKITIQGSAVDVKADGALKLKGGTASIN